MTAVSYSEARANLASLMEQAANDRETIIISRRGKEDMALLPATELAGLLETAHLLRSPANAERLLGALERARQGQGVPFTVDSLRKELGLEEE
ncbi:type II toxin-antitoxin system Phd/YefM family antitoxin [Hymenobacter aerophilus]|uniref:type II toxin-antitoxin system Phd/YefM family antitoxin n=1 Tax=Hymenobacter aerophilus TaxID=119644 RepID=UPI00036344BF|nr:type II toxin-antitoxin system prevent-host-death family antitoxin [Hymenobacter aerophilus]